MSIEYLHIGDTLMLFIDRSIKQLLITTYLFLRDGLSIVKKRICAERKLVYGKFSDKIRLYF